MTALPQNDDPVARLEQAIAELAAQIDAHRDRIPAELAQAVRELHTRYGFFAAGVRATGLNTQARQMLAAFVPEFARLHQAFVVAVAAAHRMAIPWAPLAITGAGIVVLWAVLR